MKSSLSITPGVGAKMATHRINEGGEDKEVERIAPSCGIFTGYAAQLPFSATGYATGFSIPCQGAGRLCLSARSATSVGDFCRVRLIFKSAAGEVIGVSASIGIQFSALLDGSSRNIGTTLVVANDAGASFFDVYIESLPQSGSVTLYGWSI